MGNEGIDSGKLAAGRFFRPIDWIAFWSGLISSFAIYAYTLAPTVTMEDSGELAVGGDWAGVPHPPGYPVWTMTAWVFARLFSFVTFRGQPNPAWCIAFMSVVFGALATGLTAMLICRSGSDILRRVREQAQALDETRHNVICCIAGVAASLLFALTPAMWSQAVIVEVYTMNAFFMILMFLLTYRWIYQPTDRLLLIISFIFGLSVAHYYALMVTALPLIIIVLLRDLRLFRDGVIMIIPYALGLGLWWFEVIPDIPSPDSGICYLYVGLNFLVIALGYFFLPRGKTIAKGILLAQLGVAFYIYMPLASDLRNPPINWGYPRTWQGFLHAVSRGQYEKFTPADMFSMEYLEQLGFYFSDLRLQFCLLPALVGFLGFTNWQVKNGNTRFQALPVACILAGVAVVIELLETTLTGKPEGGLYKLFAGIIGICAGIGGTALFLGEGFALAREMTDTESKATPTERGSIGLVFLGVLLLLVWYVKNLAGKLALVTAPLRQSDVELQAGQLSQILLQSTGIVLLVLAPVVIGFVVARMMRGNLKLELAIDDNSQKWIIATFTNFIMLSVLIITIANPKGDIQDNFIQKVKFITSHNMFSIWIGYGLIFALFFLDRAFRGNRMASALCLSLVAALPLISIYKNGWDRDFMTYYGGSEQNGHDFGWQFGNYQLRGARAITEELDPNEEPLPNPEFPPEMTPNAIFFGGTDPGRFVPTYMIYSARVREDVYLITQNALADNTYMAVMRDLYGDRIWIPSGIESAGAFHRYVQEVQTGKRPKNADLHIEGNRVQVSGALGVMEINGILCQMIFEHNNFRHDHYVEESYVIPWMYPYLTPHGLIMKINPTVLPVSTANAKMDLDFWDWYTRRLRDNEKFVRDVTAQKSFSKLRSAIGGLYANRGMFAEADAAFQEARLLYPLSPEANFRLIQEVLVRMDRLPEALNIARDFQEEDKMNKKIEVLVNQLQNIQNLIAKIQSIETEMRSQQQLDANKILELAKLYQEAGKFQQFMMIGAQILGNTNLPSVCHFRLAQLYANLRRTPEMVTALNLSMRDLPTNLHPDGYLEMARLWALAQDQDKTYLDKMQFLLQTYAKQRPNDWKARLDLASILMAQSKMDEATQALNESIRFGGEEARALIMQNPRFAPILKRLAKPGAMTPPGFLPDLPRGLPTLPEPRPR